MVTQTHNISRIFCIGRNYREHAHELQNAVPEKPVIFMKPPACLVPNGVSISFPSFGHQLHHEVEVVVMIGKKGKVTDERQAVDYINGVTLGLDLTLRDVQQELKQKGLPWEKAKAFEQSAPIGEFTQYHNGIDLNNISFSCTVNGQIRQSGNTKDMIFSIPVLLVALSTIWTLQPGDLLFTGTPAGVGPLNRGDTIAVSSHQLGNYSWVIEK